MNLGAIAVGSAVAGMGALSAVEGIQAMNHGYDADSSVNAFNVSGMLFDAENPSDMLKMHYRDTQVSEAISASYESTQTINRTTPIFTYANTSARKISISTYFIGDWWPAVQVTRKINWLKTFMYPRDNGLAIRPPKEVMLMLGMYLGVRGQIVDISITHNHGDAPPWGISIFGQENFGVHGGTISMFSTIAKVDITIQETRHFWTGGQITYDETVKDMNFRLTDQEPPGIVNTALNLL